MSNSLTVSSPKGRRGAFALGSASFPQDYLNKVYLWNQMWVSCERQPGGLAMMLPGIPHQRGNGIPTLRESLCSSKTLKTREKKKARRRGHHQAKETTCEDSHQAEGSCKAVSKEPKKVSIEGILLTISVPNEHISAEQYQSNRRVSDSLQE